MSFYFSREVYVVIFPFCDNELNNHKGGSIHRHLKTVFDPLSKNVMKVYSIYSRVKVLKYR